jgi:hypothetical protein
MGAPREAWSQAEHDGVDEEPAHFSWERVALIVAAGAVVVLLAFLVITALKPDNTTPGPSQTSAPVAAPPPSVVPAPPPSSVVPAPPVTVTATAKPAQPTITQASPAELDQQFLSEVSGLWGGRPNKPDAVIRDGHRACELLARKPDKSWATRTLLAENTAAGAAGGLDPETEYARTNDVVVAASDVYCPQ